jgi:5'-nucleotidase
MTFRGPTRFLFAAALALPAAALAADAIALRLIGINDLHGNLESAHLSLFLADPGAPPGSANLSLPTGGAAALAGLVRELRAGAKHSVFIGGGDLIGAAPLASTLFRHESTISILNDMGLDLSVLGNHEFDAGVPELRRLIRGGCAPAKAGDAAASCVAAPRYPGTRFKYIAANVRDQRNRTIVAPYAIRYFEGVPVGFVGAVTKTTPQMVLPSGIRGMTFLDEAAGANQAAAQLRARGVKAIVAVFHEGLELGTQQKRGDWNDPTCPDAHGPLLDIAKRLDPAIRVVFSGHTHQGYRCEIDGRVLIQGTSFGRAVSVVDVELDRTSRTLRSVASFNLPVLNERTPAALRDKFVAAAPERYAAALREARPDPAIAEKVARYASVVKPIADRPVGRIGGRFTRDGPGDSTAGRLIADSQLEATRALGAQLSFMNPGGIRANLECREPPCTVTFGEAFTMQPFGNSLVVMTLTGEQIKEALESQQRGTTGEPRYLQPSEGFTYTWDAGAIPGSRVRDMRLDGEPIEAIKGYRVTVNSFVAESGDGFDAVRDGTNRVGGGQDIDALMAYLAAAERAPAPPRIARIAGKP